MLQRLIGRMSALCLSVLLLFSLTGCLFIPQVKKMALRYDVSEITSIEIYDLGDAVYGIWDLQELMEENFIPITTLEAEQYSDFVDKLEKFVFKDTYVIVLVAPVDTEYSFCGYIAKITYVNGEFEVLNYRCQLYHDNEGSYPSSYSCDEGDWNSYIQTYLDEN